MALAKHLKCPECQSGLLRLKFLFDRDLKGNLFPKSGCKCWAEFGRGSYRSWYSSVIDSFFDLRWRKGASRNAIEIGIQNHSAKWKNSYRWYHSGNIEKPIFAFFGFQPKYYLPSTTLCAPQRAYLIFQRWLSIEYLSSLQTPDRVSIS